MCGLHAALMQQENHPTMRLRDRFTATAVAATALLVSTPLTSYGNSTIVGYQKISLGPGYNFVGINFKSTETDGSFDIQTLFDTSTLHGAMGQSGADQIYMWDADQQTYVQLWLFDSEGAVPSYDGKWVDGNTQDIATQTVSLGDGFWYIRQPAEEVEAVVLGAVEESASIAHTMAPKLQGQTHSYNVFVSAYPLEMAVNDMNWSGFTGGAGQTSADQIYLWDAQNQQYVQLWLFDSGGSVPAYDGKWIDVSTGDVAGSNRVIPAGGAVWMLIQNPGDVQEVKPF